MKKRVSPNLQQIPRKLFKTSAKTSASDRVPEWLMQAAVIADCHKWQDAGWKFMVAGDMNGVHMTGSQAQRAKMTGMTPGETDLRYYFQHGVLRMIELKAEGGRLSKEQILRHEQFCTLGHVVEVVYADSEASAVEQCGKLLGGWLVDGIVDRADQRPVLHN